MLHTTLALVLLAPPAALGHRPEPSTKAVVVMAQGAAADAPLRSSVLAAAYRKIALPASPTLRKEAHLATVLVYGSFHNPRGEPGEGTTDFLVERIVRGKLALGPDKTLRIPRYVPFPNPKAPPRFLLFGDLYKGQIDWYRGAALSPAGLAYVQQMLTFAEEDNIGPLLFCVNYLNHADPEMAQDAWREFEQADPRDVAKAATRMPAAKLRLLLQDPKTPERHLSLYALLLAHCGKAADGALLRKLPLALYGYNQVLAGLVLLQPIEGWKHLRGTLQDPKNAVVLRLQGIAALDYLRAVHPDVVAAGELCTALSGMLGQQDLADLAVDRLRQWKDWTHTKDILGMYRNDLPRIVQRSIVRYALVCPQEAAGQFINQVRAADSELVDDMEELLMVAGELPQHRRKRH
jgi:hypothetical protein